MGKKDNLGLTLSRCLGCGKRLVRAEHNPERTDAAGSYPLCWVCANTRWTICDLQQGTERQFGLPIPEQEPEQE